MTQLVANLSAIYSPELTVGFTPACCSDHQVSRPLSPLLYILPILSDCLLDDRASTNKVSPLPRCLNVLVPSLTLCTTTAVRLPLIPVCFRRYSLAVLLGDLSDREGYDFDQVKSIAKVQVRTNHTKCSMKTNFAFLNSSLLSCMPPALKLPRTLCDSLHGVTSWIGRTTTLAVRENVRTTFPSFFDSCFMSSSGIPDMNAMSCGNDDMTGLAISASQSISVSIEYCRLCCCGEHEAMNFHLRPPCL